METTTTKNNESLLTTSEVADILKVQRATISQWVCRGQFPRPDIQKKRFVRWEPETVFDWIETQKTN